MRLHAKLALGAGLLLGAGFGGFAIAQAAGSAPTSSPGYASNVAAQNASGDQSTKQEAAPAAATPSPTHGCPNHASHSASPGGTSSS